MASRIRDPRRYQNRGGGIDIAAILAAIGGGVGAGNLTTTGEGTAVQAAAAKPWADRFLNFGQAGREASELNADIALRRALSEQGFTQEQALAALEEEIANRGAERDFGFDRRLTRFGGRQDRKTVREREKEQRLSTTHGADEAIRQAVEIAPLEEFGIPRSQMDTQQESELKALVDVLMDKKRQVAGADAEDAFNRGSVAEYLRPRLREHTEALQQGEINKAAFQPIGDGLIVAGNQALLGAAQIPAGVDPTTARPTPPQTLIRELIADRSGRRKVGDAQMPPGVARSSELVGPPAPPVPQQPGILERILAERNQGLIPRGMRAITSTKDAPAYLKEPMSRTDNPEQVFADWLYNLLIRGKGNNR